MAEYVITKKSTGFPQKHQGLDLLQVTQKAVPEARLVAGDVGSSIRVSIPMGTSASLRKALASDYIVEEHEEMWFSG